MTPSYKSLQSNRKNTKVYGDVNVRLYGCWSCQRTDLPLKNVGKNQQNQTIYACRAHEQRT